ncbi:PepSY domain-containing protein [Roseomonas sp. 18066]|uniref:PepSY domain-containing protein n=1 Tax=Roseomonas sp. 18066 TaxID=2681412 RepID=UPI00135BDCB2|nr:PepSY domain-containing protein [Roseomonas sp. 18066]
MRILTASALALLGLAAIPAAAMADDRCPRVARDAWMPMEQVVSRVQQMGYTAEEISRDDGCWEVEARDRNGVKVEFKLDPVSGALVTRQGAPGAPAGQAPR